MNQIKLWGTTNQLSGRKCPVCQETGQKVAFATVKNLVLDPEPLEDDYSICLNPECKVVYFNSQPTYLKQDLKVKVWYKEKTSPVPVCYCKNVTDQDIYDHIVVQKCCSSLADIQKHTSANTGKHCLTENPTGKWCGATVQSVIAKALQERNDAEK